MTRSVTAAETQGTPNGADVAGAARAGDAVALRGSLLFLVGRVASMGLGLLVQVLVVRSLSKGDYGAFAYATALAALIQSFLPLGLDRSDTYFLTRYDEAGDSGRVKGFVAGELIAVGTSGAVAVAVVAVLAVLGVDGGVPLPALLCLVATAPLMAADALILNAFAVFAHPRAVFLRRYVMDPVLRLAVVLVLMLAGMALVPLAAGYLVAAAAGTGLYLVLLARLTARTTAAHRPGTPFTWPGREVAQHALPLLVGAVMYAATTSLPTLVLNALGSPEDVAQVRAVQPVAALILVVPTVFSTLFLPRAARLAARSDDEGLRRHYWSTAVWVAVLAFPAVVLLVAFADAVTDLLFGARYAGAGLPLAVMAFAFYTNAALGLNGSLLQVTGRLRALTIANGVGLLTAAAASLALVPRFGADGAAWAVAAALLVPQALKQASLRSTPVGGVHPFAVRLWAGGGALLVASWAVRRFVSGGLPAAVVTTALAGLALVVVMRGALASSDALPLGRLPGPMRRLFPSPAAQSAAPDLPGDSSAADTAGARSTGEVASSGLPGTWQPLDWRFLSSDPALRRVALVGTRPEVLAALTALGEDVAPAREGRLLPDARLDTVIASSASCEPGLLAAVTSALVPGGRLVVEVTRPPASAGLLGRLRPLTATAAALRRSGLVVEDVHVAIPQLARTSALVRLSDRPTLTTALRRQPVTRRARAVARVAVVAVRLGLGAVVVRQGVVLARVPGPATAPGVPSAREEDLFR